MGVAGWVAIISRLGVSSWVAATGAGLAGAVLAAVGLAGAGLAVGEGVAGTVGLAGAALASGFREEGVLGATKVGVCTKGVGGSMAGSMARKGGNECGGGGWWWCGAWVVPRYANGNQRPRVGLVGVGVDGLDMGRGVGTPRYGVGDASEGQGAQASTGAVA